MSEPIDITEDLNRCREASRGLWNTFLRPLLPLEQKTPIDWDLVSAFDEIRTILFREMVLMPIGQEAFARANSHVPYPFIKLIPTASQWGIPIMVNRSPEEWGGYWDDPVNRIGNVGTRLLFVDYFDWDVTAFRDFQFYLAQIARFPAVSPLDRSLRAD